VDIYSIDLKRFHLYYFACLLLAIGACVVLDDFIFLWDLGFAFYLGLAISFLIQLAATELRFLPIFQPSLRTSGFGLFTVPLFFLVNLGVLTFLVTLDYPIVTILGFLIAYFLHLLFFVIASYFSGK
jgi:hypothetical protein